MRDSLSELAAFSGWNVSRPWGPDDKWSITLGDGGAVLTDLLAGLNAHPGDVAKRWSLKAEAYPVVLGCVPWFTDGRIFAALRPMTTCIVVNKDLSYSEEVRKLAKHGRRLHQMLLRGLEMFAPETEGGFVGPHSPMPGDRELEPVRVLGYPTEKGIPLLHAKLAVCCAAWIGENEGGGWEDTLTPMRVWLGSANWTHLAEKHIEFGAWTSDEALCDHALAFVTAVIEASEPLSSTAPEPVPDLGRQEFDDDAMREYLDDDR